MIQAITVEREFGCGGSEIARLLAQRLGWDLWDERLTQEIARLAKCSPEVVEKRGWRKDPAVYRVFLSFLRGAFEGGLPPTNRLALLDARRIATVSEAAVNQARSECPCVIVGRGSQYFLRNRKDVFRTFLYASRDYYLRHKQAIARREWDKLSFVGLDDRQADHPFTLWQKSLPGAAAPALRSSYGMGVLDGVLGGSGLGVLAQLAGSKTSDLVCVEKHIKTLDQDVWLVQHPALRDSDRMRTVANLLVEIFR